MIAISSSLRTANAARAASLAGLVAVMFLAPCHVEAADVAAAKGTPDSPVGQDSKTTPAPVPEGRKTPPVASPPEQLKSRHASHSGDGHRPPTGAAPKKVRTPPRPLPLSIDPQAAEAARPTDGRQALPKDERGGAADGLK